MKVWHNHGLGSLNKNEEGIMGYFSIQGHRSPLTEGRPGGHAKMMAEILANVKNRHILKE